MSFAKFFDKIAVTLYIPNDGEVHSRASPSARLCPIAFAKVQMCSL